MSEATQIRGHEKKKKKKKKKKKTRIPILTKPKKKG
jgi:hypothetical protein